MDLRGRDGRQLGEDDVRHLGQRGGMAGGSSAPGGGRTAELMLRGAAGGGQLANRGAAAVLERAALQAALQAVVGGYRERMSHHPLVDMAAARGLADEPRAMPPVTVPVSGSSRVGGARAAHGRVKSSTGRRAAGEGVGRAGRGVGDGDRVAPGARIVPYGQSSTNSQSRAPCALSS